MQLAFAAGGALIGGMVAPVGWSLLGMGGASWGWAVGGAIGGLFGGKDDVELPPQFGPRLEDRKVQTSTYGNPITRARGSVRVAGNLIEPIDWVESIVSHTVEQESGGKGGGGSTTTSQTQNQYVYHGVVVISVHDGAIVGIRKVWCNGKIKYDVGEDSDIFSVLASIPGMTVYLGTETQTADPTLAALHGTLTPAYRGTAYVVWDNLNREEYGNFEFEVVVDGAVSIMVPRELYTLPSPDQWSSVYPDAFRSGPLAEILWINKEYSANPRGVAGYNNYTGLKVAEYNPPAAAHPTGHTKISGAGLNGRMWFAEYGWGLKAITPGGAITEYPSGTTDYGNGGTNTIGDLYEYPGPVPADQETDPYLYYEYDPQLPNIKQFFRARPFLGTRTQITVGGHSQYVLCMNANRISGRLYFTSTFPTDPKLNYVVPGETTPVTIRTYSNVLLWPPYVMVGKDGYLYARSANTGDFNLLEKMDPDGTVVDSVTLTGPALVAQTETRMVMDDYGKLYVQVAQALWRINYGTMEIEATATLADADDWIIEGDAFQGKGVLVTRIETTPDNVVRVLLDDVTPSAPLLSDVVTSLCLLTGLTTGDLDVSQLTADTVSGYVIARRGTVRSMIEPLMGTYFFDAVESDNKIKFVKRGSAVAVTIPEDDLAAHTGSISEMPDTLRVVRKQELELPVEVNVAYLNRAIDYQVSQQPSRRLVTQSKQTFTLQVPIVLSDDQAKRIADTHIFSAWVERENHEFETGREYLKYEPCDVIGVTKGGVIHNVRIVQKDEGGDGVIKWKAVADYVSVYTQVSTGAAAQAEAQTVSMSSPTQIEFLDVPLLRDEDDDPGFYFAASGTNDGWRGVNLHQSTDGGVTYSSVGSLLPESTMGYATDALGDYEEDDNELIDEGNSVTVVITGGSTLASVTRDELLNGANPAILGGEVIQFRDATLIDTDTYTLTGLLRGRRGSETFMSTHAAGDRFVLLNANLRTVSQPLSLKDQALFYKPVSIGRTLAQTNPFAFVNTARRKKPLAPVQLGAGQNAAGDWVMTWRRRTRYDAQWLETGEVPLGESTEAYVVRIMSGATVRRTINVTTPTATYTVAQQVEDFGSARTALRFEVAQLSGEVGEGYATSYFVNPDPFASTVVVLMHMDGADGSLVFTDDCGHAVANIDNVDVDTAQSVFGGASAKFDGTGTPDHLEIDIGTDFDLGTEDFTLEGWIRFTSTAGGVMMSRYGAATKAQFLIQVQTGTLYFYSSSDGNNWNIAVTVPIGAVVVNTWYHVAVTREGTTFRTFLDGVIGTTFTSALALWNANDTIDLGSPNSTFGWIDEVRISRGICRYNAAFTPPTAPFAV